MKVVADVKIRINIDYNKPVNEIEANIKDFIAKGKYTIRDIGFKMVHDD